jgi:DNA gyrase subunit B
VTLLADGGVRVRDDGRGIPVDEHPVEHRPAVEVVMTTLHAGGKFDGKSYAVSGGLHGVGVSVVNALSSARRRGRRDGYVWTQSYERGAPVGPLQRGASHRGDRHHDHVLARRQIFETTDWSFETLSRRMQEMAFLNRTWPSRSPTSGPQGRRGPSHAANTTSTRAASPTSFGT